MQRYDDEIQLKDILIKFSEYKAFLLKKRFFIIAFSFLFIVFGVVYALLSDIEYNAELTFVVESDPAEKEFVVSKTKNKVTNKFFIIIKISPFGLKALN